MNDDLLTYYNAELAYLRELGAEFARKYPKVAARLLLEEDKCADPHVERLLEGFALLAARVRKKLDDELPEITNALLSILAPQWLRPVPSLSVVQLIRGGDTAQLANGHTIARGARLNSRPVGGSPCVFQTAYPVTLWPLEVAAASLQPDRVVVPGKPPESVGLIQLSLRCLPPLSFDTISLDRLRFYLDGDGPLPYTLHELILNQSCAVWARGTGPGDLAKPVVLPADALRPVGLERDEGLWPQPNQAFVGFRLLQEYFAFPEKFLFFDLVGLETLRGRGFGQTVELLIFLKSAPRTEVIVGPENFRLGCTPAVNLFPMVAEPIVLDETRTEYRVIPDVQRPFATEVHAIEEVSSVGSFLEEPIVFEPFYALRHDEADRRANRAYWFATRQPSPYKDDAGTEVYLTFVDPRMNPRAPAGRTVTVRALCTNRDLPARLPFGGDQADLELEAPGPVGRARCLRKPTVPLRPPTGRGSLWRLINLLSVNHLSLTDSEQGLEALRTLLRLCDFADSAVTRQQVEGITTLSSKRAAGRTGRGLGNAVCLGVEVTLTLDEARFVGSGAYLFASVLERFLGAYASINSFSRLVVKTRQREGVLKRWPPRSGDRILI